MSYAIIAAFFVFLFGSIVCVLSLALCAAAREADEYEKWYREIMRRNSGEEED